MKKFLFVCAALACCHALAQAGIVKDYFSELCALTAVEPIDVPAEQIGGEVVSQGVEAVKMLTLTDETNDKAVALAESWDKSKLLVDLAEENNSLKVFAEQIQGTDNAECLIMIRDGGSPLVFVYMEGNAKLLESINVTND